MYLRLLAFAMALVRVAAQAGPEETKPQLLWQGEVDGTALLYVHAKRLIVEAKEGGPVERQRYHISDPLPQTRQDARLRVMEGRGYVHIVEQPRAENDFTLAIAIEDRQQGSSSYSIAVSWETAGIFDRPGESRHNQVKWSGRVEGQVIISCAKDRCASAASSGAPVMHERYKFSRPLPRQSVAVSLQNVDGRGEVKLVEQPSELNGYTARVQIRDPQGGAGDYAFTLAWPRRASSSEPATAPQRGFLWSGQVAGTVRVALRGGASYSQALSGDPVTGEQARFERSLPSRSDLKPSVKKLQGPGTVEIVELPSSQNGYQLVFEVRNTAPAADRYEVEVAW